MSTPKTRLASLSVVMLVVLAGVVLFRKTGGDRPATIPVESAEHKTIPGELPDPAPLESRYLNTASQAEYVGNDACASCHADEYESYLASAHAAALRLTDAEREPVDVRFYHEPSRRWYQVYRQEGQLRHRESIRDAAGREVVLQDEPLRWTIGSGRFSLSYLIADGDFMIESPVTWYSARQRWEMSPGYDEALHEGFERLADQGCLMCHAGRITPRNGNQFQPVIHQTSIGCESCHGPGSLHVERRSGTAAAAERDWTIVNPRDLDRQLAESVCANCHLRGEATSYLRGRTLNDFRPGFSLTDVRIDYGVKAHNEKMEVVGHMEQMRMSRCYTQSQNLTCLTCHNPHEQPSPEARLDYYRASCLQCHSSAACGLTLAERHQTDRTDNCVACHMPQTETDIPHFAFTHHRIGIHRPGSDTDSPAPADARAPRELVPYRLPPGLPPAERDRALGLAYLEYAAKHQAAYGYYLQAAREHLLSGAKDGEALAALAVIDFQIGRPAAAEWADLALQDQNLSARSRVNALVVRASLALDRGAANVAVRDLREATSLRRRADYWFLLAQAEQLAGRAEQSVRALERAVEIAPHRIEFRQPLSHLYRRADRHGDADAQDEVIAILKASATAGN